MNPYCTHQEYLKQVLSLIKGNMLECGIGEGSTPIMRDFITDTNHLVSLESHSEWYSKYEHYNGKNHELHLIEASNDDTPETCSKWISYFENNISSRISFSVAFIDCSPWSVRLALYEYLKNKIKIIIIHDFDYFIKYKLVDMKSFAKCYKIYDTLSPPTLICSNIMNPVEFNNMIQIIS